MRSRRSLPVSIQDAINLACEYDLCGSTDSSQSNKGIIHMSKKFLAVAAASLFALPSPACAATFLITITGDVTGGVDPSGFFGSPGGTLAGNSFVASMAYDSSLGERRTTGKHDSVEGGSYFGTIAPITAATLTVNGKTVNLSGDYRSWASEDTSVGAYAVTDEIPLSNPSPGNLSQVLSFYFTHVDAGFDTSNPYSGPTSSGYGQFLQTISLDGSVNTFTSVIMGNLTVNVERTSSSSPGGGTSAAAVPEPASWAMLIAGFGVVGASLRSRRQLNVECRVVSV